MTCYIWSNTSFPMEYGVKTTSAMKCAHSLGRGEPGETVEVRRGSKLLSRVLWSTEERKYIRVAI